MRWTYLEAKADEVDALADALGISNVLAKLLCLRGIKTFEQAKTFFRPSLDQLHDPFLMKGMSMAVERIKKALNQGQKIMIYGDYDVDGSTAVSLVYGFFNALYPNLLSYYIPDRYSEGYGVSFKGIDVAKEQGISLIITLDCGIKSVDKVAYANELGIDVIIGDHHTPGPELPQAVAILNPKQVDCPYPYKELPGCGIGFKLCWAFAVDQQIELEQVLQYIDLVAIAIACDIVPITGENRVITALGLEKINTNPNLGVLGLLDTAFARKGQGNTSDHTTAIHVEDLVFKVGPRINAAGRIRHAKEAVALLSNQDKEQASALAKLIDAHNEERKGLDKHTTAEALAIMEEDPFYVQAKSTVLYKEDWHKGVIGIVASRLIETHYKPTIVFTKSGDYAAGSARSVKNYNVYEAIEACSDTLIQFGGHMYAAGLTIKTEHITRFRAQFEHYVARTITEEQCSPELEIDAELNFEEINDKFYRILKQFGPFGPHNMKPVFITKNVIDAGYTKLVGSDAKHVKFHLKQANSLVSIDGIGFGLGSYIQAVKEGVSHDYVYCIEENSWKNKTRLQLVIKDIRVSANGD